MKMIILTLLVGLVLFVAAHAAATEARGYSAIGGEMFLIILPLALYAIHRIKTEEGKENG